VRTAALIADLRGKTPRHLRVLTLDSANTACPSAQVLAQFHIVITSFSFLSAQVCP
jgi:hypothetical protein